MLRIFLPFEWVGWQTNVDLSSKSITMLISRAIHMSSLTSKAQELPYFVFTAEMAEKREVYGFIPLSDWNTVGPIPFSVVFIQTILLLSQLKAHWLLSQCEDWLKTLWIGARQDGCACNLGRRARLINFRKNAAGRNATSRVCRTVVNRWRERIA